MCGGILRSRCFHGDADGFGALDLDLPTKTAFPLSLSLFDADLGSTGYRTKSWATKKGSVHAGVAWNLGHKSCRRGWSRGAHPCRGRNPLTVAVARALRWQELLDQDASPSMCALAEKFGVDARYVARLLDLTLLAPDIIGAILSGREPDGLSPDRLHRAPMEWDEQRRTLGFAPDER